MLYRIAQRFGLPVVPEWAGWFNEEINRRGAIKPLIGLGCSPVLVSGTKKLFLKWIRIALRQKRIEVPDCNGPVRWNMAHSFFRINQNDLEEGSRQEISDEISASIFSTLALEGGSRIRILPDQLGPSQPCLPRLRAL